MNRILLIVDILGFSNIIKNLSGTDLEQRIKDWIDLIEKLCDKYSINDFQLLSDTLFVSMEDNQTNAEKIVSFSRDLLTSGIDKSIPLRGAISCGEVFWGKFCYGKALIEAHKIESEQNWIGITCASTFKYSSKLYDNNILVCYPPCFKSGEFKLMAVVNWEPPKGTELFKKITTQGLMNNGEVIDRKIQIVVDNTNLFRLYKEKMMSLGNLKLDKYYGHYYTHFLDF